MNEKENNTKSFDSVAKKIFGNRYMTEEKRNEIKEKKSTGEYITLYEDKPALPPFENPEFDEKSKQQILERHNKMINKDRQK